MRMSGELTGKVAIVTGGASGIGAGCVARFVDAGAQVVIADVNTEAGEALAAELGGDAAFKQTDVADNACKSGDSIACRVVSSSASAMKVNVDKNAQFAMF